MSLEKDVLLGGETKAPRLKKFAKVYVLNTWYKADSTLSTHEF